jgi:hypothetical protein
MEHIFIRTSSNLPNRKERRVLKITLPLVDTNGSVKKLTLFLPGLASLQSSRTKFSVTWLQIFRPSTRHHRIWRTSTTFPKTSHPCNVSKTTYKVCTSELKCQQLNNTAATSSTTIDLNWSESQGEWRHQQLWPTMTLGWIGLTPNYACC